MPKQKVKYRRKKEPTPAEVRAKDFLDMTVPGVLKFNPDHFICGSTYRSVWAMREYPTNTDEKALLRHLGEKGGVTLHVYSRAVTPVEERRIIQNAANKHKMDVELMGGGADATAKMAKKPVPPKQANMGNAGGSSASVESGSTMAPRP